MTASSLGLQQLLWFRLDVCFASVLHQFIIAKSISKFMLKCIFPTKFCILLCTAWCWSHLMYPFPASHPHASKRLIISCHTLCILVQFVSAVYGGIMFCKSQRSNLSQSGLHDVTWTLLSIRNQKQPHVKTNAQTKLTFAAAMFGCCKGQEKCWLDSGYLQWYSGYATHCSDTNLESWVNTEQCRSAEHKNSETHAKTTRCQKIYTDTNARRTAHTHI